MAKTAVGLFLNRASVKDVIHELGDKGYSWLRVIGEPLGISEQGAMSIAHTDFEANLARELKSVGANEAEIECYIKGLQRGGVVVLAGVADQEADLAAEIMNRHDAIEVEELRALAPHLPAGHSAHKHDMSAQYGRLRSNSAGGARLFFW